MRPILEPEAFAPQAQALEAGSARRRRTLRPGGGFLFVLLVYALLGAAGCWVLRPSEAERLWQDVLELRTGRLARLDETELAIWRRAIGRHPAWLASLSGGAATLILTPHRAGLVQGRSALLLRQGAQPAAPMATLSLSLQDSVAAGYRLRGFGSARAWTREGRLLPGQALLLSLPPAEAGGEVLALDFERPLRVRLSFEARP